MQYPSLGGAHYWLIVIDQFSKYKWDRYLKEKSELGDAVINIIKSIQANDKIVKYLRCDNAGENKVVPDLIQQHHINNITMEFTAPRTPQQNGLVERSFAFLYNRVRAMLNQARFSPHLRQLLWAECCHSALQIDNLMGKDKKMRSHEVYHGHKSNKTIGLHPFGELVVIKNSDHIQSKLKKGMLVIYLGITDNDCSNTFRFLNVRTKTLF